LIHARDYIERNLGTALGQRNCY